VPRKTASPPSPPRLQTETPDAALPRDRHGYRGVPPPATFDIYALPDSAPLTMRDVAAHGRWAVATVEKWRQQPDHPLKWFTLPGGFVRTTVGDLKQFLASGKPRPLRRAAAPSEPPPPGAPARRRTPRRPRVAEAEAPAGSSS